MNPASDPAATGGDFARRPRKPILKTLVIKMVVDIGEEIRVAARYRLDGGMIPRTVKRMLDERAEARQPASSATAALEFRGRRHVVRLINTSSSGAMVIFPLVPHIGERVSLQLLGQGQVSATVRWVRDGRIGVNFDDPLEQA